jgi:hypothetical protein
VEAGGSKSVVLARAMMFQIPAEQPMQAFVPKEAQELSASVTAEKLHLRASLQPVAAAGPVEASSNRLQWESAPQPLEPDLLRRPARQPEALEHCRPSSRPQQADAFPGERPDRVLLRPLGEAEGQAEPEH